MDAAGAGAEAGKVKGMGAEGAPVGGTVLNKEVQYDLGGTGTPLWGVAYHIIYEYQEVRTGYRYMYRKYTV
jgi:hypothetical protein